MGSSPSITQSRPWIGVIFAVLIALAAALWVYLRNQETLSMQDEAEAAIQDSEMIPASEALPQTLDTLDEFLSAPVLRELPKRFRFETLFFESGTVNLMEGSEAEIEEMVLAMKAHPAARARLEAFTDNIGDPAINQALSERRAQAVKGMLVQRGIAADRIEAIGRGAEDPITSNISADGRSMNRRLEFVVTSVQ